LGWVFESKIRWYYHYTDENSAQFSNEARAILGQAATRFGHGKFYCQSELLAYPAIQTS
jgi:hypothetical protein